jgi:hypothetical protein
MILSATSTDNEIDKTVSASCTAGKKLVGGGYRTSNVSNASEIVITSSYPSSVTTWTVTGTIDSTTGGDESYSLQAYALCASAL